MQRHAGLDRRVVRGVADPAIVDHQHLVTVRQPSGQVLLAPVAVGSPAAHADRRVALAVDLVVHVVVIDMGYGHERRTPRLSGKAWTLAALRSTWQMRPNQVGLLRLRGSRLGRRCGVRLSVWARARLHAGGQITRIAGLWVSRRRGSGLDRNGCTRLDGGPGRAIEMNGAAGSEHEDRDQDDHGIPVGESQCGCLQGVGALLEHSLQDCRAHQEPFRRDQAPVLRG